MFTDTLFRQHCVKSQQIIWSPRCAWSPLGVKLLKQLCNYMKKQWVNCTSWFFLGTKSFTRASSLSQICLEKKRAIATMLPLLEMSNALTWFSSHAIEELRVTKENTKMSMQQTELQLIDTISPHDSNYQTTAAAGNFSWSRKALPKVHKVHCLYLKLSVKQLEIDVPLLLLLRLHKLN